MDRVWNLESRTCVQEMTAHRKKFDESILDVAFHPSRPYIASAGTQVRLERLIKIIPNLPPLPTFYCQCWYASYFREHPKSFNKAVLQSRIRVSLFWWRRLRLLLRLLLKTVLYIRIQIESVFRNFAVPDSYSE